MASKNSKAGSSGSASGDKKGDKKGGKKATFQGRHTTPYPKYRRGGLVFTKAWTEYTTGRETFIALMKDPHLDLKTPANAAAAATGKGDEGGSEGGDGSGDTGGDAA